MTKEEAKEFLDNTKVYVNGKSKEIQEKLFSFGYVWVSSKTNVTNLDEPFLFINKEGEITYTESMTTFMNNINKEITAEEILSLEVTEPSYRPFQCIDECWNEMLKHQPFGWLINKETGCYVYPILYTSIIAMFSDESSANFNSMLKKYTFPDGTSFGIEV